MKPNPAIALLDPMPKPLILSLAIALGTGLIQNRHAIEHLFNPVEPMQAVAGAPQVILYATEWCGYCAKTRNYLRSHAIAYEERDIEKSASAQADYRRLGGQGVPLIVVDERRVIHGYDPELLAAALGL